MAGWGWLLGNNTKNGEQIQQCFWQVFNPSSKEHHFNAPISSNNSRHGQHGDTSRN